MKDTYDVIIIGGGINGCGIARDLALRGVSVLLVEKTDFGAGATGNSSGMIHGGLRYLESEVETTRLSCLDSGYIQKIAPHLVFRIPFIFPILNHKAMRKPKWYPRIMKRGVEAYFAAYDEFQPLKNGKPSTSLDKQEALTVEPGLTKNIIGAVTMDEWGIDAYRLCLANALDAERHGADVLSYTEAVELLRDDHGAARGVLLRDSLDSTRRKVYAPIVLNCGGPWGPKISQLGGGKYRLRPGKGIHIVYGRRISNMAIIAEAVDGRQVFLMPHENSSWIGTTDDDYYGDLDDVTANRDEVEYLLEAIATVYPNIRQHRPIFTIAGVRATLYEYGKLEDKLSRSHKIYDHSRNGCPGFYSMAGGKLASYRIMSEEAADLVAKKLGNRKPCRTHELPLPGGGETPDPHELSRIYGINPLICERIVYRHGSEAAEILDLVRDDPAQGAVIDPCDPVIAAEINYTIEHEHVRRLLDLRRRVKLSEGVSGGVESIVPAVLIFARHKKLNAEELWDEIGHFHEDRYRHRQAILDGQQLAVEEINRAVHFSSHTLPHKRKKWSG